VAGVTDLPAHVDATNFVGVESTRHHGRGVTEVMSRNESAQVSGRTQKNTGEYYGTF
jgi:hypothetical protein